MQTYSQEMMALSFLIAGREEDLRILREFAAKGGEHRLSISVDHPDPVVKETIERIARDGFPGAKVMESLNAKAEAALQAAKLKIFDRSGIEHGVPSIPRSVA